MTQTLYNPGVIPSFSRPRVNNDNPFSESFFKTVKYTAGFPKTFCNIDFAGYWMADFVNWYNVELNRCSSVGNVLPDNIL